jgi:hypothetical protein
MATAAAVLGQVRAGAARMWTDVRDRAPDWRRDYRQWRRTRPFWGGLVLVVAGLELLWSSHLDFGATVGAPGFEGFMSYLLPAILVTCGVLTWFAARQRMLYSVVAVVTALYSLIGLNLGGFLIGTILGIVGASMAFGWAPTKNEPRPTEPRHRADVVIPALLIGLAIGGLAVPTRAGAAPEATGVAPNAGTLTASRLVLEGFAYRGVVQVATSAGTIRVLKFTMESSVLDNFTLTTDGRGGRRQQTRSGQLTVSGGASLYVSRFSGRLGIVPLTFTPLLPPPFTLPRMTFTDVRADLVLLLTNRLHGPTLHFAVVN